MQVGDLPPVDPNVDLTQILPIQQKRTIAFVNHFIMKTVSYLNKFAQSCESRFMDFEYKIQKIEASLLILESQLSSISGLDNLENSTDSQTSTDISTNISTLELPNVEPSNDSKLEEKDDKTVPKLEQPEGVKACDDPRFKKFFKMLQFGVPQPAIKLKMKNEGVDPNILDPMEINSMKSANICEVHFVYLTTNSQKVWCSKPNDVIPGLTQDISKHSNSDNSNSSESD